MEMFETTALFYIFITFIVIVFQLALAFGAPWGEFTQGGRFKGTLPLSGRILAVLSLSLIHI